MISNLQKRGKKIQPAPLVSAFPLFFLTWYFPQLLQLFWSELLLYELNWKSCYRKQAATSY